VSTPGGFAGARSAANPGGNCESAAGANRCGAAPDFTACVPGCAAGSVGCVFEVKFAAVSAVAPASGPASDGSVPPHSARSSVEKSGRGTPAGGGIAAGIEAPAIAGCPAGSSLRRSGGTRAEESPRVCGAVWLRAGDGSVFPRAAPGVKGRAVGAAEGAEMFTRREVQMESQRSGLHFSSGWTRGRAAN
jgi:hypothetical protein